MSDDAKEQSAVTAQAQRLPTRTMPVSEYNENDAAQRVLVAILPTLNMMSAGVAAAELVRLLSVKGYKIVSSQV